MLWEHTIQVFLLYLCLSLQKVFSQTIPERLLQFQTSHDGLIELMNAMKRIQTQNYYPSDIYLLAYYSVPNWIVANSWMHFQA